MTRFITIFLAFSFLCAVASAQADDSQAKLYVVSDAPPPPQPASQAAKVTDGMTLTQLAALLGPGWMSPQQSILAISWFFSDGRQLIVSPERDHLTTSVLTFRGSKGRAWMRWEPR